MNYQESSKILDEIKKVDKILLNCHRSPDPDSIGSALALYKVLSEMDKNVRIICPTKIVEGYLSFLTNNQKIEIVDFENFDFSRDDLFIVLDSSSWNMAAGVKQFNPPKIPVVVIDHHKTNEMFGSINLVDDKTTSTGELLYKVLEDWGIEIDKEIAEALLVGIIGDTGAFRFPDTGAETLKIAGSLMEKGANKDDIVFNIYQRIDFQLIKFWGEVLTLAKLDKDFKFVWCAIPYKKFLELGKPVFARESAAMNFFQIVEGTDFGVVMVEQEPRKLSISLRSRTGLDTSKIATKLGGGGRTYASGAEIDGVVFEDAVEKVLAVAREVANEVRES